MRYVGEDGQVPRSPKGQKLQGGEDPGYTWTL